MNSAMVRFAAQYRADGREAEVRSIYAIRVNFRACIGINAFSNLLFPFKLLGKYSLSTPRDSATNRISLICDPSGRA